MSTLKPYEQVLKDELTNLPLPNENLAWEKMAELLREEDDDTLLPPPPVNNGCLKWVVLLGILLLGAAAYLFLYKQQFFKNKQHTENKIDSNNIKTIQSPTIDKSENGINATNGKDTGMQQRSAFADSQNQRSDSTLSMRQTNRTATLQNISNDSLSGNQHLNKTTTSKTTVKIIGGSIESGSSSFNKTDFISTDGNKPISKNTLLKKGNKKTKSAKTKTRTHAVISGALIDEETSVKDEKELPFNEIQNQDSLLKVTSSLTSDSINKKVTAVKKDLVNKSVVEKIAETLKTKDETKSDSAKKKFWFAAGIAIQQGIPLNGESIVPYNYYGRKGSLADYIPSIYFRVYRQQKWFIQQEFRYGAPQYEKEYVYKTIIIDTSFNNKTTAAYTLKKTYYHQLPLSFNYFVQPNWSVGVGVAYSKFSTAISQENISKKNLNLGIDTLISSLFVKDKDDSIFTKNNFQWLFETQYIWKRFSFGAMYVRDIKPYIEFMNSSSGLIEKKKSYSANIFIRYELWRSKQSK
ncbi:MAG: hypothetical protein H7334_13080 [Ferruginibacter sp.]|nr:hypothetical protein [Ferruginibacter sp.]